jgi:hypothetical protein
MEEPYMSDEDALEWWPIMSREEQTEWITQIRQRHVLSGMLPALHAPVAVTTTAKDVSAQPQGIDSSAELEFAGDASNSDGDGLTVATVESGREFGQHSAEDEANPDQLLRPATTAAEWLTATQHWGLATPLPLPVVRLAADTEPCTPGPTQSQSSGPPVALLSLPSSSSKLVPTPTIVVSDTASGAESAADRSLDAFIDIQDDDLGDDDGPDMLHRTPWAMMCSQQECTGVKSAMEHVPQNDDLAHTREFGFCFVLVWVRMWVGGCMFDSDTWHRPQLLLLLRHLWPVIQTEAGVPVQCLRYI